MSCLRMNCLNVVVLLVVAMLIPLGTVHADGSTTKTDVWAKLKAAVKAGKISPEDAKAKMVAIKKAKAGAAEKGTDLAVVKKKLYAAVKSGKLTKKEAWAKWIAITKGEGGA